MPDRIQRNRTTGEYRIQTETGWQPYMPPEAANQPEMYHPRLGDDPTSAAMGELLRTGKEAAIGVARSPLDVAKGLYELVTSPVESARNISQAATHPGEILKALADNPREAGSALGQLLLTGKFGPKIPGAVGKIPAGVSAAGRGVERAGTALAKTKVGGFGVPGLGALDAILGAHPGRGLAIAATPYALKYGGKGIQAMGSGLERLKEALTPTTVPSATYPIGRSTRYQKAAKPPARVSREVPYRAAASASPRVRAARATPEAITPSAGPRPEMAARVVRAAEANPRRTSLLDELQHELTSGADPGIVRQRVTRAAGGTPEASLQGRTPAPSTNPMIDALPPPETDAWTALRTLRNRSEAVPSELDIELPSSDPLSRLDVLRARQAERHGRTTPFRSESMSLPERAVASELPPTRDIPTLRDPLPEPPWARTGFVEDPNLPTSWRTGIHNTVQEDIRRILETLRRRPTPDLTNPTGR